MLSARINTVGKRCTGIVLIVSCLHGCSSSPVHSSVDDSRANMISGTLIIRPESWRSDSDRRGHSGIELGYEHQSGKGTQSLKTNEFVQYGSDVRLNGPQKLSHDVSVDHAHIAYNRLMSFGSHFQLEPAIGIAHDEVNIESNGMGSFLNNNTTGDTKIGLRQTLTGVTLGVIPRWNFNHYFAVELPIRFGAGYSSRTESVTGTFSSHSNNGLTEMINPSLVFYPSKNVALSVGYIDREQSVETAITKSNIDLSFSGVSAAIRVIF